MSKDLRFALLLDCYGEFLTPHQAQMMEQYYCEDLSLSEIAVLAGITRQGVHDGIKRGEQVLLEMEQKLHFVGRLRALQAGLTAISGQLQEIAAAVPENAVVQRLCETAQRQVQDGLALVE